MRRSLVVAICLGLAGTMIAAPLTESFAESFLSKAKRAIRKTTKAIEGAAKGAAKGAEISIGMKIVVTTPDGPVTVTRKKPAKGSYGVTSQAGAGIGLSATQGPPGSSVTVDATGLPKNADMSVAAGSKADQAEKITDAKSSGDGEVVATITVPGSALPGDSLVFVVASADQKVRLVSDFFKVVDATKDGGQSADKDQGQAPGKGSDQKNGEQAVDSISSRSD